MYQTTQHSAQLLSPAKTYRVAEWCYSTIECEALGILHGLDKFYHYCFAGEVCIMTDYKPLAAISKKDVAMLSQLLQCIMLQIHQYLVTNIYKADPDLVHHRLAITETTI